MSNKIIYLLIFIICGAGVLIFESACNYDWHPNKIRFSLFSPACKLDTLITNGNIFYYKTDAYLILNYKKDKAVEIEVDSFACAIKDSLFAKYAEYHILFYRESKITNNESIRNNPRNLDRYSEENDLRYIYIWSRGKFISKSIYNGQPFSKKMECVQ